MTVFLGYGGIPPADTNYPPEASVLAGLVYGAEDQFVGAHVPVAPPDLVGAYAAPLPPDPTGAING